MFGTLGISELIIILVIVLIIFGAGRLPQIGEGLGKALKGFKKEVHEAPPPPQTSAAGQKTDPLSMEERIAHPPPPPRGVYPPVPPSAQPKPVPKRPSAVVNKDAVARVQAQQAALKAKADHSGTPSPQDMQSLGEGVGDALRTFRQAVSDVRGAIDPQVRTIQAEIDAAQKEIDLTMDSAKQQPAVEEEPPKKTGA